VNDFGAIGKAGTYRPGKRKSLTPDGVRLFV
jgi:hypothetical protein